MARCLIFETHPELGDALSCVELGYKIPYNWLEELEMQGLLSNGALTPVASSILSIGDEKARSMATSSRAVSRAG